MHPKLLLLHGAIGAKDQLLPLAEKLRDGHQTSLLSFSGHGDAPGRGAFTIKTFAEDVLRHLDEQKIETCNIFGYSMGGYVALYLASQHPGRVKKISTLGTKFAWSPEIAVKETKMLDAEKIEAKVPAFAETLGKRHSALGWKQVLKETQDMMTGLGNNNVLTDELLKSIRQETLLMLGEQDTMVSREETEHVASLLPASTFKLLAETPHPIEKVDSAMLAGMLNQFYR